MQVIVEAGSSKSDVAVLSKADGVIHCKSYPGLNPSTDPDFDSKLREICQDLQQHPITEIYYYGSGVIGNNAIHQVEKVIRDNWNQLQEVSIEDDLLGAAKSVYGNDSGFIGILGTGSNFGYYDGHTIQKKLASCGYLLGDEGSGYRIGQAIYTRFARLQFPPTILDLISSAYSLTPDKAVIKLYKESNPRTYLAGFAKIIRELPAQHQNEILNEVFDTFISKMVHPLVRDKPQAVSIVGSIAFHFQDIIRQKFKKSNIIAGSFVRAPIEGLIKYHEHG